MKLNNFFNLYALLKYCAIFVHYITYYQLFSIKYSRFLFTVCLNHFEVAGRVFVIGVIEKNGFFFWLGLIFYWIAVLFLTVSS